MYANTTAEVEVEKESLRRRRIYLFIVSATIFFLILFVATITPLLILKSLDDQHAASIHQSEYSSADHWAITFHSTIVESISSVHALGGYVMSTMNVLPPLHGTVAERLAGQTFTRFPAVAGLVSSTMGEIAFQALAPGGAFLETFPPDASSVGFDMFSTANPIATESPTPQATLLAGTTMTVGPHRTTIPGLHDLWTIDIYHPIYNITNYVDHSADNFWGFAVSSISLDSILENNNLPAVMEAANMDYMLYGRLSNGTYYVVETSMPAEYLTSQKHIKRFLSSSSSGTPILDYLEFTIAVQSREKSMHLTSTNVTIIVSCAVAGTLLIFAIAACLISSRTARYDGRKYAPKQAPFALLTVGPTNGEELWTAAPERMDAVTERLTALLKRSMVEHEAYEIAQLQSYTTSYVLRSVPEAVEMALTIIEELQRHPVDAALRGLTECDPHVWMAYAVHWCTEATVLIDPTGSSYAYEGKDVVYGGRLRVFAQPNRLTLSGAAKTAWLDELAMQHRQVPDAITLEPLVIATPPGASKERFEDLWLYTDRRRKLAVEAMEAAAKRVSLPPQQGTNNSFMDEDGMDGGIGGSAHRRNAGSTEDDSSHGTPLMSITALEELGYTPVARHHVRQASTGRLNSKITVVVPQNPGGEASPHAGAKASGAPPLSAPESEGAHVPSRRPGASTTEGSQSNLGRGSGTNRSMATVCLIEEGDAVTRLLLSPTIPPWLAKALRTAFDHQAIALGIDFDTVRVMVYYFYVSYKLLFAPLATPERANINRRLVTAFGVPQRGITEHLAARCAIRYLQQREEVRSRMWNRQLRQREHTAAVASPPQSSSTVHAPAQPRVSTASETASVRS